MSFFTRSSATCICKASELSIRQGMMCAAAGKQPVPRWEKAIAKEQKVNCWVPS